MLSSPTISDRRSAINLERLPSASAFEFYSDSRKHGSYHGPIRNVRYPRATSSGGGCIAKSEDGVRCVVAGRESLRILRMSESSPDTVTEHKSSTGRGGHTIAVSRNLWDGSGLKVDSTSTDVIWGHGIYNNKILTSARNGDLIMWDLNKSGTTKYERRTRDHIRSIHQLSYSAIVQYYCISGSADGDVRVWDLRDLSRSLMKIHHPTSVRSVIFSPSHLEPLQAMVGLDNGSIYRWDLKMVQRGQLDRLPMAHSASILSLDWRDGHDISTGRSSLASDNHNGGLGWVVSGGLDRTVKVWDLTGSASNSHFPHRPVYTLHPSFPVRRVLWRPGYECEIAVASNADYGGSNPDLSQSMSGVGQVRGARTEGTLSIGGETGSHTKKRVPISQNSEGGDHIEIWDARRGWVAKWLVEDSAVEGGVTDILFSDSHAIWAQHSSGAFSQLDLRRCGRPLDALPRNALSWEASGSLMFVAGKEIGGDIPYDDIAPEKRDLAQDLRIKLKGLKDGPAISSSQSLGTLYPDTGSEHLEIFAKLARGYIYEGRDRNTLCQINAEVAMQAGQQQAAQLWLLLGALLESVKSDHPPTPPLSPLPLTASPGLSHSASAPAAIPTLHSFTPSHSSERVVQSDSDLHGAQKTHSSPIQVSKDIREVTVGMDATHPAPAHYPISIIPNKLTPASSPSSSPRRLPSPLAPITPKSSSILSRGDSASSSMRRHSSFRRASVSILSGYSDSPRETMRSHSSLRHVGEGALDSDSSGSGEEDKHETQSNEDASNGSVRPVISSRSNSYVPNPHPSPLSHALEVEQLSADEYDKTQEDEDDSPPILNSSGSESEGSEESPDQLPAQDSPGRKGSQHAISRSRSSTIASLAASAPSTRPRTALQRQSSLGSVRTVVAPDGPVRDFEQPQRPNLAKLDHRGGSIDTNAASSSRHSRSRSQAMVSEFPTDAADDQPDTEDRVEQEVKLPANVQRQEMIKIEEEKYRALGWLALREVLENSLDEGDIQTCAMLALIAPQELQIGHRRITRILESYIDILRRLRMHTSAAYLCKYSLAGDIRASTGLETTIHTSCGRCGKAIVIPMSSLALGDASGKSFSYCLTCRSHTAKCSICHLPIRALLFGCTICGHGGHQECYQRYYGERRRMVEAPSSSSLAPEIRGRSVTRPVLSTTEGSSDDGNTISTDVETEISESAYQTLGTKVWGRPCAAGCGHICWATNANVFA